MNKLLKSMGTAAIVLLSIALIPISIFLIAGILMYFGMNLVLAVAIGAFVVLFSLITMDIYVQDQ